MDSLVEAGLGLDYGELRLDRTTQAWLTAGQGLQAKVATALDGVDVDVELIGSSSVLDLLAKPIIDVAVGMRIERRLAVVTARLEAAGWIYRGDAGEDGGHVFVLEARPWYRVAHLHGVERQGRQWRHYLRLRDLLRESPAARARYEGVKAQLAEQEGLDRRAYTEGKTEVVLSLLDEGRRRRRRRHRRLTGTPANCCARADPLPLEPCAIAAGAELSILARSR